jgi:outer membrane protein TolC
VASRGYCAEIRPLVPPLACCGDWQSCPCVECIRLPAITLGDPNLPTDPVTSPAWPLSVHDAIDIALTNSEAVRNLGLLDAASDIDKIRARITTYDPLIAKELADSEWGVFDPVWTTTMQWDRIDIPPGTSFGGIGNRPPELDTADFLSSLEQLLPSGTRFRADYATDYLFNPMRPPSLDPNPQYFSYTQFGVRQPLLQGLGTAVTMAPIRIAAAEAERTDWKFKEEMLALVRSVETSYWTLYAQQEDLQTIEEVLHYFREVVRIREQQAAGGSGTESEVARARSELLMFEQRRLQTLSLIAEQQLVVRNLLGLTPNDNRYLKLVATPTTARPAESVGDAVTTAINRRPNVLRQRLAVYVAQQQRVQARDSLKPLLDFNAFWRVNGLGDDLGGSLNQIGQDDYNDWRMGLTFQVPLGRRQARSELQAARFNISKQQTLLRQSAHQTAFQVADAYRRIDWLSLQHQVAVNRVNTLGQWREGAKAQLDNPPPGMSVVFALELYLQNLRDYVDASINAHAIVADYNGALARLEEVKGTLLDSHLVAIEGDATERLLDSLPLPDLQVPASFGP